MVGVDGSSPFAPTNFPDSPVVSITAEKSSFDGLLLANCAMLGNGGTRVNLLFLGDDHSLESVAPQYELRYPTIQAASGLADDSEESSHAEKE